jgi:hypothetical protein
MGAGILRSSGSGSGLGARLQLLDLIFESITFSSRPLISSDFQVNELDNITLRDLDVGKFAIFRRPDNGFMTVQRLLCELSVMNEALIDWAGEFTRGILAFEASSFRSSCVRFPEELDLFFDGCAFAGGSESFSETGISANGTVVVTNCTVDRFVTGLAMITGSLFVCNSEFTNCERGIEAGGSVRMVNCRLSGYSDWGVRIGGNSSFANCAFFNARIKAGQSPPAIEAGLFALSLNAVCVASDGTVVTGGVTVTLTKSCFRSNQSVAIPNAGSGAGDESFECHDSCTGENGMVDNAPACDGFPVRPTPFPSVSRSPTATSLSASISDLATTTRSAPGSAASSAAPSPTPSPSGRGGGPRGNESPLTFALSIADETIAFLVASIAISATLAWIFMR